MPAGDHQFFQPGDRNAPNRSLTLLDERALVGIPLATELDDGIELADELKPLLIKHADFESL
jgi:hypothetical protein